MEQALQTNDRISCAIMIILREKEETDHDPYAYAFCRESDDHRDGDPAA
jgi:hypothetical protein